MIKHIKNQAILTRVLLLVLITLMALPACKAAPILKESIRVGGTYPLNTVTGKDQLGGTELAFEQVNAVGGINGRQIQFTYYNDEGNTEKVTSNIERLITTDKCVILTGCTYSAHGVAANQVAKKYSVPIVSTTSSTDELNDEPLIFRCGGSNTQEQSIHLARAAKMGLKKISLLWINSSWGVGARDVMIRDASKYGLTLVGHEGVDSGATDVTVQLTKLKALKPDCVIVALYEKEIVAALMGIKTIAWDIPVLDAGSQIPAMLTTVDPRIVEGVYTWARTDFSKPLAKELFDAYEKKTGQRAEYTHVVVGYDAARIIAEALRIAGNPDNPASIGDAVRKVNIPLTVGKAGTKCDYSNKNWLVRAEDQQVFVIKSGKLVAAD